MFHSSPEQNDPPAVLGKEAGNLADMMTSPLDPALHRRFFSLSINPDVGPVERTGSNPDCF